MKKGIFITLEGPEGSGKTTTIKMIEKYLADKGLPVLATREPGGIDIAEQIRNVVLNKANTKMDPIAEALLYAASRRQHLVEKVIPALEHGMIVICDRFVDSSVAYQGVARGLGVDLVREINRPAIQEYMPDLTIILDVEPEIGLQRIGKNPQREVNRLDLEGLSFHNKVREGYLNYIDNKRTVVVDASGSIEEVYLKTKEIIDDFLNKKGM